MKVNNGKRKVPTIGTDGWPFFFAQPVRSLQLSSELNIPLNVAHKCGISHFLKK